MVDQNEAAPVPFFIPEEMAGIYDILVMDADKSMGGKLPFQFVQKQADIMILPGNGKSTAIVAIRHTIQEV